MNIVKQSREFIPYYMTPIERIEYIGKVCTKRDTSITDGTANKFFKDKVCQGHTAVAAHGFLYFKCPYKGIDDAMSDIANLCNITRVHACSTNSLDDVDSDGNVYIYIAINYRSIIDIITSLSSANVEVSSLHPYAQYMIINSCISRLLDFEINHMDIDIINRDCKDMRIVTGVDVLRYAPDIYHLSIKFITDRGVANEFIRHTAAAFMQESTRWCNYSGKGVTFIKPYYMTNDEMDNINNNTSSNNFNMLIADKNVCNMLSASSCVLYRSWINADNAYNKIVKIENQAQAARAILPLSTKTELWITASLPEWLGSTIANDKHPIEERNGIIPQCSHKSAHPDRIIAVYNLKDDIWTYINSILDAEAMTTDLPNTDNIIR